MSSRLAKMAAAGVAAAVLGVGVAVGVVNARPSEQSPTATPTPGAGQQRRQQAQQRIDEALGRLAQNLGVSVDKLRDALKQTAIQEIDAAQAAGRLTPEQAQRAKDAVNSGTFPGLGLGIGFGPGGPRGGPGGPERHGLGVHIDRVDTDKLAQFLGVTRDQLKQELKDKSLAEAAAAHGKTAEQLKQFIIDNAQQQLAQAVQNGRLTQQQADQALNMLKSRLDELINRKHHR